MKKLILFSIVFLSTFNFLEAQVPTPFRNGIKTQLIEYLTLTTTERNALSYDTEDRVLIFNETSEQFEYWDGDSWETLGGSGADFSEWAFSSGTRVGGDLELLLGEWNADNNGTVIGLFDASGQIFIGETYNLNGFDIQTSTGIANLKHTLQINQAANDTGGKIIIDNPADNDTEINNYSWETINGNSIFKANGGTNGTTTPIWAIANDDLILELPRSTNANIDAGSLDAATTKRWVQDYLSSNSDFIPLSGTGLGEFVSGNITIGESDIDNHYSSIYNGITDYENDVQDGFKSVGFRVYDSSGTEAFIGALNDLSDGANPYMSSYNDGGIGYGSKVSTRGFDLIFGSNNNTFNIEQEYIGITSNVTSFRGLEGNLYFGNNYNDLSYTQKKYVDDFINNPKPTGTTKTISITIDLDENILPHRYYSKTSPSTSDSFTINTPTINDAISEIYLDTTGDTDFPTLTGVDNVITGAPFEADTLFKIIIFEEDGEVNAFYLKWE